MIKNKIFELENYYDKIPKHLKLKSHNPNFNIHKMKLAFRLLIIGSSGSGKTQTLLNIIKAFNNTFMTLTICTKNSDEPLYNYLKELIPSDQLTILEGIENIPELDSFNKNENNLIVFDDLILDDLKKIGSYFIRARKLNVSCIFISQTYYSNNKDFKIIRRNINYLIIKKVSSLKELNLIMREYSINISKEKFYKLYNEITKIFVNFLMIDCDANDDFKFRLNFDVINI
jgi:DNA polymerase III delta prime subunit